VVIRLRFDLWEFATHEFRIETRDIDNMLNIEPVTGRITVKGAGNASAVTHLLFTMHNLHFAQPGVVNFTLYIDNKEISTIPLYVRQAGH
jgi:hypothetical protein